MGGNILSRPHIPHRTIHLGAGYELNRLSGNHMYFKKILAIA
jgi:hypothetical protein